MKYRILGFFILLTAAATFPAHNALQVIKPASKNALASVVEKIRLLKKEDDDGFYAGDGMGYVLDINNDGKEEYVFLGYLGSARRMNLWVFTEENGVMKEIGCPFSFEGLYYPFINPVTDEEQLFFSFNNKNYFCYCDDDQSCCEVCIWKNNKVSVADEKFVMTMHCTLFDELYKQGRYDKAFSFLNFYEASNRNKIDPQIDLWIKNDVALAALRAGRFALAMETLQSIEKSDIFSKATPTLVTAVKTNKELCRQKIEEDKKYGSRGRYDYAWLLEHRNSTRDLLQDHRFDALFAAVVPDAIKVEIELLGCENGCLLDDIKRHFFKFPCDTPKIIENRYVSFNGCLRACASHQGFIWCDIKKQVSVVAIGDSVSSDPISVYLTSRSIASRELPKEFFTTFKEWLKDRKIAAKQAPFYDRAGAISTVRFA